jgi:hypothetical protein
MQEKRLRFLQKWIDHIDIDETTASITFAGSIPIHQICVQYSNVFFFLSYSQQSREATSYRLYGVEPC